MKFKIIDLKFIKIGKMYKVSFQHTFRYLKINKSIQLKHGEAFYDLHTALEKNSVINI